MFILGGGISIPPDLAKECQPIANGIFLLFRDFQILLVELDSIDYDRSNQFLGLFASSPIRRKVIAKALLKKERFIISYSYFLFKDEVVEVAKAENIEIDPRSLSIRAAVESIGIDKIIEEVGLARVIEEVGIPQLIEKVSLSRLIEEVGISRLIEEVGISQMIEAVGLGRLLNELTPEQRDILRKLLEQG